LIKAEAVKCKHCKSDLPGFEPKLAPTVPVPEKNNTDKQAVVENESPSPKKKIEPESGKLAEPKSDEWWHNPKTRKKMYAVAGTAAVLILLLIVILVAVQPSSTDKAVAAAAKFVSSGQQKHASDALACIDPSEYPLLRAELCQGMSSVSSPADWLATNDLAFEKNMTETVLPAFFKDSFWQKAKAVKGEKIAPNTYAVVFKTSSKTKDCGTMVVTSKSVKNSTGTSKTVYMVDWAGTPAMLGGIGLTRKNSSTAEQINDSVNKLLANPSKESCLTAVSWTGQSVSGGLNGVVTCGRNPGPKPLRC